MPERTYTTTEISRICDVYPATVINWIDSGELRAYVTPGGHRRVTRTDLLEFLKKFSVPVPPELLMERKHILIVEDDLEMSKLLERAFNKYKHIFEVSTVADGMDALLRIGQRMPHLVVLDIMLPRMDGWELAEKLRASPQTNPIKIIVITGKKIVDEKLPNGLGVHAIFRKPFELADVVKAAAKVLRISLEPTVKETNPIKPII